MAQNLALEGGSEIEPEMSNVGEDYGSWSLPGSRNNWNGVSSATNPAVYNGTHIDNKFGPTVNTSYDNTGAYYNWCTAVANTCGKYLSNNQTADDDICPKRWRLPANTEYVAFGSSYMNNVSIWRSAFATSHAGLISDATVTAYGQEDNWSATSSGSTTAYRMYSWSNGSGTSFSESLGRVYGMGLRCLIKLSLFNNTTNHKP